MRSFDSSFTEDVVPRGQQLIQCPPNAVRTENRAGILQSKAVWCTLSAIRDPKVEVPPKEVSL